MQIPTLFYTKCIVTEDAVDLRHDEVASRNISPCGTHVDKLNQRARMKMKMKICTDVCRFGESLFNSPVIIAALLVLAASLCLV